MPQGRADRADAVPHVRRPLRHRRAPRGRTRRRRHRQPGASVEPRAPVREGPGGRRHRLPSGPPPRAAEADRRRLAGDPARAGAGRDRRASRRDHRASTARAASASGRARPSASASRRTIARRFIHAVGSPNYLSNDSMCYAARYFGFKLVDGAWPSRRPRERRAASSCGERTRRYSHPNMTQCVTAARRKGATLVVVDPRLSAIARRADLHAGVRPGTDGALALGLDPPARRERAPTTRTSSSATRSASPRSSTTRGRSPPSAVEAETGVPAATVRAIARAMESAAPRVALYVGQRSRAPRERRQQHPRHRDARRAARHPGPGGRHLLQRGGAAARPHAVRRRAAEAPRPPRRRPLPGAVRPASGVPHA